MRAEETDDGVAHLPVGPVSGPFCQGAIVARVWVVGQASAEDVDAGLPVFLPVVGQPGHGVHSGQAHRWLVGAELGGNRSESLIQHPGAVVCRAGLRYPLPPVGHDQGDERPGPGH